MSCNSHDRESMLAVYEELVDELHRNGKSIVEITEDGFAKIFPISDEQSSALITKENK